MYYGAHLSSDEQILSFSRERDLRVTFAVTFGIISWHLQEHGREP